MDPYGIQPVYIEDLADLAVEGVYSKDNYVIDAVGPDSYTFKELVQLIGEKIGAKRPIISLPPRLALLAAQFLSLFIGDVILTPEEVDGLMANLLVSKQPARGKTAFKDWLEENKSLLERNMLRRSRGIISLASLPIHRAQNSDACARLSMHDIR